MKCQHCEKTATFHITELTHPGGPAILHLCEEHARDFFSQEGTSHPATALTNMLSKQLKLEKISDELSAVDNKQCPMCGSTDIDQKYVTTTPYYQCNKCGERFKD